MGKKTNSQFPIPNAQFPIPNAPCPMPYSLVVYNQLSHCLLAVVSNTNAVHCINPECQRPYPQPWGNKFCNSCGAPLQLIDRYVPLQFLGSGGFAKIYTVWDQKTQTEKVLKVLIEDSPKALELFAQEATVLINLRHPGVPKVEPDGYFQRHWSHPKGQTALPCLVMEKINGQTLEEIQKQYPQGCPQDLVINWLTQVIEILQHLHQRNIIHRDIKPSNMMLRTPSLFGGDQLVLIDFGGAKQFAAIFGSPSRSTKLFSSGYSPPEQVIGGNVGPTADFYALGRTMIELLTGKHPVDLEDPITGELRWRNQINVNSQLADLLDEMVKEDARSRPTNAAIILKRLAQISKSSKPSSSTKLASPNRTPSSITTALSSILAFFLSIKKAIQEFVIDIIKFIRNITVFIFKGIFKVIRACLNTIWAMLLTSIGASVGTIIGFIFAGSFWGKEFSKFIYNYLTVLLGNTQAVLASEILIFAGAGLGTAWGLVAAGGYGQKRRFCVASLMGIISYSFGWLVLQIMTPKDRAEGVVGLILAAVSLLTLGLGLRSHHIVHAVIAAFGTAIPFAFLMSIGLSPTVFDLFSSTGWSDLTQKIIFFVCVGVFISFWLGVSYYLVVPGLKFLGWRN